ncbi:MAG: 4-hydroxy-tetrahydrodipicolinate reductase [Acidobacteriota bacterium]
MRISLIGYGKMGRAVERLALQEGHDIVHVLRRSNNPADGFSGSWVGETDVLVDFSAAAAVLGNVSNAVKAGLPIVEGVTGWQQQAAALREEVEKQRGACLCSANFSIGVQLLFRLTQEAGKLFSRFQDYRPYVLEYHHAHKQDAPSGSALSLKRSLEQSYSSTVPVSSVRAGAFPGVHEVGFDSPEDTLILRHSSRNRDGFARGALFACQWIQGKRGFYDLQEVLFREKEQ